MRIILANPRGFCAGVNMAIDSLERRLAAIRHADLRLSRDRSQPPVVERFRERGVVFVDRHRRRARRGHGSLQCSWRFAGPSRSAAEERRLHAIDATCPLVTKVHLEAVRFAREGYTILLIGHDGHDEVIGTMGEAPDDIRLVRRRGRRRPPRPAGRRPSSLT